MYLFSRSVRLAPGQTRESMAWAIEITEKVNQASELQFGLWTPVFSPGVGRLTWATFTEDLAPLESLEAKLMADEGYIGLVDRGATFGSGDPIDDQIVQLVHDATDPQRAEPPAYVAVVTAMAANGQFARAVEVGVQIAQAADRIASTPTSFGIASTGPYGQVHWMSGYDDIGQLQQSEQAINGSSEFMEILDRDASAAYLPGASSQFVVRRVA